MMNLPFKKGNNNACCEGLGCVWRAAKMTQTLGTQNTKLNTCIFITRGSGVGTLTPKTRLNLKLNLQLRRGEKMGRKLPIATGNSAGIPLQLLE